MTSRHLDPQSRMFGVVWGLALALALTALLTVQTASAYSMSLATAVSFGAHTACGPLEPLLRGEMLGRTTGVAFVCIALIAAHFVRPCAATFALTCAGVLLWVGCGCITQLMLA
jgi:hypothetical protein